MILPHSYPHPCFLEFVQKTKPKSSLKNDYTLTTWEMTQMVNQQTQLSSFPQAHFKEAYLNLCFIRSNLTLSTDGDKSHA